MWANYRQNGNGQPTSTSSSVGRASLDGGSSANLATGWVFSGLAVDDQNAFWADTHLDEIQSVPKSGGATVTRVTGEAVALGPVVDAHALYWSTQDGRIQKLAKPDTCP